MKKANQLLRRAAAASVVVALLVGVVSISALAAGRFTDDDGNIHEGYIEAIAEAGITKGCNPPDNDLYCPDEPVTRGAMAAFLVRALGLTDPGDGDLFTDDDESVFEDDIDRLATAGITKGCNPPENDEFCPDDAVTRGEMAAFLVRALDLTDPGGGDLFTDDDNSVFEDDIDKLATEGITKGCNPPENTQFCPHDSVLRDQMASFLGRALGLEPIEPPTTTTTSTPTSTTMVSGDPEFTAVQFDAPCGDDNNCLNEEWVEITNLGSRNQAMTGWILHDEVRIHEYRFPEGFVLGGGDKVTVYTGSGYDTSSSLYWGLDGAIWNNDGDTAYLRDARGNIVDTYDGP